MKNIPLFVSIAALAVAVIALIGAPTSGKSKNTTKNVAAGTSEMSIAYVNLDTLVDAYDFYNDEKTELLAWSSEKETSLDSRYKALQRKAMELQQQVQSNMMTPTTAQKKGEQLGFQEQEILRDKQAYEYEAMDRNQKMTLTVFDSIKSYLKIYNEDKNYRLILANDTLGTSILLGDEGMDITREVLDGLNKRYRSGSSKKDTTSVK
jgi:outer membrane protein